MTVTTDAATYAICVEETLGHRAHGVNLLAAMTRRRFPATMLHIVPPARQRVPLPWALRGSIDAWRSLRATRHRAVLFHTQTISLLAPFLRGTPYLVSLDATPLQMDALGAWYSHSRGSRLAEWLKHRWYRLVLRRAAAVITWTEWAADSVRHDYAVEPRRLLVAHPGAGGQFFQIERAAPRTRPTILFVGGQFERKGGPDLLDAFQAVRDRADLVIVTEDDVPEGSGAVVRRGIRPGTDALIDAFAGADIFCLPTLADCTPVVIGEAAASGLPVITTTVGSNPETLPSAAGVLVPPGDRRALRAALIALVDDPEARAAIGKSARQHARLHMDAERNANAVLDLIEEVAATSAARSGQLDTSASTRGPA